MSDPKPAARRTDLINHGIIQGERMGKIAAAVFETGATAYQMYKAAKTVAVVGAGVVTSETGGWGAVAVWGASWVVEWAVSKAIEEVVSYAVRSGGTGIPGIKMGSDNVFINKLEAARGAEEGGDPVICHPGQWVRQGSQWVTINSKPAARLNDMTKCPGHIVTGSKNVNVGGPPIEYNPHATLDWMLFGLTVHNAIKKGMVNGIVAGGSLLTSVGKEVGQATVDKFGRDAALDAGWDKVKESWPWK